MNPNKALRAKGDFTRIANRMRESGAELVKRIGIQSGQKVLDVGCGDGQLDTERPDVVAQILKTSSAYTPPPRKVLSAR